MPSGPIRTRSAAPDIRGFPDFFVLGPQRTGSTWLHANLVRHPQIRMHRDKETFYFSTLGQPGHPRHRYEFLEDYMASFSESFSELALKNYHALRRCGRIYRPMVTGESTASYCVLPDEVIDAIMRLRPGLKAILFLRDPVARAWSHATKDLVRGRAVAPTDPELRAFLSSPDQLARADYAGMIARWRRHLLPQHLLVLPYERIAAAPVGLLDEVSAFLGAERLGGASARHVSSRQNPAGGPGLSAPWRDELSTLLAEAIADHRRLTGEIGPGKIY
jgi:hypothetical protein